MSRWVITIQRRERRTLRESHIYHPVSSPSNLLQSVSIIITIFKLPFVLRTALVNTDIVMTNSSEDVAKSQTIDPGSDLLSKVIEAHGDLQRWNQIQSIEATWNFSGGLLSLKGYPEHYQPSMTINATKPTAVIQRLGTAQPDDRWWFDMDRTWIEKRDGPIVKELSASRASFTGHTRSTPWDELQLTYFVGYAMWNYIRTPFIFLWPCFSARELQTHQEFGQT